MTYQALLLDLDGVLRHWPQEPDKQGGLPPGAALEIAFEPKLLSRAITGKITDEKWRDLMLEEIERKFPEAALKEIKKSWDEKSGQIDQEVLTLIESVAKKIRVTLVTNATSRLDSDLKKASLGETFYAVVNSSKVGVAKPEKGIFETALTRSGVSAQQALFVDDSLINVQAATSYGIRSHHFVSFKDFKAFLVSCGVM